MHNPLTFIPLATLVIFALMSAIFWLAFWFERKDWNGGVCRTHGQPWRSYATDSQGGRLYKCTAHVERPGHECGTAASYPVDSPQPIKGMLKITGLILGLSIAISTWGYFFGLYCQR
jgi:hypothetical protein